MSQRIGIEESARRRFADIVECFDRPCVVGAPHLAQELLGRNAPVAAFTSEREFAELPGFREWSLNSPIYVEDEFDFVFVAAGDAVRAPTLFHALRVLCHFHFETPVLVVCSASSVERFSTALEKFEVERRESPGDVVALSNFELP